MKKKGKPAPQEHPAPVLRRELDIIDKTPERNATVAGVQWRIRNRWEIDGIVAGVWNWLYGRWPSGRTPLPPFESGDCKPTKCPICGQYDNDWPTRGGLCLDCFCHEWLLRHGGKPTTPPETESPSFPSYWE